MTYEEMTEEQLRALQEILNEEVNNYRKDGNYEAARAIREELLRVQAVGDKKQQERYAEYNRIAAESEDAQSVRIDGVVADADSDSPLNASDAIKEAEAIVGRKG